MHCLDNEQQHCMLDASRLRMPEETQSSQMALHECGQEACMRGCDSAYCIARLGTGQDGPHMLGMQWLPETAEI